MAAIDDLIQQILGQNTTAKWTGEGYGGAEANAKAMAKLLADAGITDIRQFGKVDKYEPVEVVGYSLNGNTVQNPSKGKYYEMVYEGDSENGPQYRRRDLTPQEIAQVQPVYGIEEFDSEGMRSVRSPTSVVEKDGKMMGVYGTTFGNKETGQAIQSGTGRWQNQRGEGLFGGTGEGKGNTAFRADFTPDGTPVFYTTQGTSNDLAQIIADIGPIGSIAANYLAMQFGGPAGVAALNAAQGKDFKDVAKATLLAYAGGEASKAFGGSGGLLDSNAASAAGELNAASDLASSMADQGMSLAEINQQLQSVGYNSDAIRSALEDASNIISSATGNVSAITDSVVNPIADVSSPITNLEITAPSAAPVPTTLGNVISSIAQTQVIPEIEVTGKAPKLERPEQPIIPILSPSIPELTVTDRALIKEKPSSITGEQEPLPIIVAPPIDTTLPTKKTDLSVSDALRAAGLVATLAGAGSAMGSGGGGFPIVPIPSDWTSPIKPTGVAEFTPLAPIDFGNKDLLKGTQWEKLLDPNYGKAPAMPSMPTNPSNMDFNQLMGILGNTRTSIPTQSVSINDVIAGIQSQYGQTPTGSMG